MRARRGFGLARALFAAAAILALPGAQAERLLVFAAASLRGSLDEAARGFEAATGHQVRVSYAASSALARQIEAGAPAHVFISADPGWVAHVEKLGRLKSPAATLVTNELVLVAPADSAPRLAIAPGFALARALGEGRLAIADPDAVPAGRYARAALESLGAWGEVRERLAPAPNVRVALNLVARGEAPLGIVYRSDARAEPRVAVVGTFPRSSHPPIAYAMAVLRGAPAPADELARHLASPAARPVWERHGFGPPA